MFSEAVSFIKRDELFSELDKTSFLLACILNLPCLMLMCCSMFAGKEKPW